VDADQAGLHRKEAKPVSSKRRLRRNACKGKQRFNDQDSAMRGVQRLVHAPDFVRKAGRYVNAYRCHHCGGWHVGHSTSLKEGAA
jgi:hypothetical protein